MIRYIHEPTEKMQLLVVRRNPEMITLLENPCERAQLLAVMADSGLITAIGSPSANTQLSVVRKDPHLIREISVPDWKAQLYAVGQDPELIRFISEPAEKVQLSVLNGDASLIRLVRTPTEKAQMLAVGRNSSLIGHIKNPTEKVQLMAVHDSPANILRIKNPSRQACLSCLGSVMPGGTAGIHFKEDISEAVKNLFTRLGEIEERYGELMRDAGHMDTYDARYEATEKAEAYRTRKISAAVGTFRKEAVLETSAVPEKTVAVEKTEATEAQPSSGEMRFKGGRRELTLDDGTELQARWVLACDGAESHTRRLAGIGVSRFEYRQHCMLINIDTDFAQEDITWQQFTPSGPRAFLPLPGRHGSLVWYDSPARIRALAAMSNEALAVEVRRHFPSRLGGFTVTGKGSFPLVRRHANDYHAGRVVLLGDAAHTINPLAGQGVNLGFKDVACWAGLLGKAGAQWHELALAGRYEGRRRPDNLLMQSGMDLFYGVFSNEIGPLRLARNLALNLADKAGPLKEMALRYALGLV
jgi:ubiquinone biosynthesis UbiH/UbiF/VisC/COQ6 family hydroxylase